MMQHIKKTILCGLMGCGLVSGMLPIAISPAWAVIDPQNQMVPPGIAAPTPVTFESQPLSPSVSTTQSLPTPALNSPDQAVLQPDAVKSDFQQPASIPPAAVETVTNPEQAMAGARAPEIKPPKRLADPVAHYNDKTVTEWQQRLLPYLDSKDPAINYQAQKAAMWLLYAANEGSERSLTTARQEALQQASSIIAGLEQHQPLTTTTPILSVSSVMRRDLWAKAELLKQHPGFECATSDVAQAEVMLVWAAAEHCELGWRHSRELFASAERSIGKASYEAFSCKPGVPQQLEKVSYPSLEQLNGSQPGCHGVVGQWPIINTKNPVAEPEPTVVTAAPVAVRAVLPNTVHFALDQSSLSAVSREVLDQVIAELKIHPDYSLTLYGYTDSRASAAYNQALSRRRAQTVERYLNAQGIVSSRIATVAAGESKLIADSNEIMGYALSRRVELVFASSEGQEILTESQRKDLQPER